MVLALAACGDDDDDPDAAFCDAAEAVDDRFAELDVALEEGERPAAAVLGDIEAELEALAADAPAELAVDLGAMTEAVRRLATALEGVDLQDPGALEAIADDLQAADEDLDRASDRVAEHLREACGIDIGDAGE